MTIVQLDTIILIMKGEVTLKILEAIGELAGGAFDVFDVIASSGYGASQGRLNYELSKRRAERETIKIRQEREREIKARFNSLLYKLERDGLIERKDHVSALTSRGKSYLTFLKNRKKDTLPVPLYEKSDGDKFIILIFDIPEKERRKRGWLRSALKNLELKMIQKSVWAGKVKLPKTFLDDLNKLKLVNFVEIFEISKTGSLRQIN